MEGNDSNERKENDMHTALCSFDTQQDAQRAVDRLVQAGFPRRDVHLQHKHVTAEGDNSQWGSMGREAGDRGVLHNFGEFFASLFGRDHASHHVDTYSQAVERGSFVVVVDGKDQADAARAQLLLREMQGGEATIVHRQGREPLRDIVGARDEKAGMTERGSDVYEDEGETATRTLETDRAMDLGGMGAAPTLGTRSGPDLVHAPGLRYADKDKPI